MKPFSKRKEIAIHITYWLIFLFSYFVKLKPENKFVLGFDEITYFEISFLFVTFSTFYLNYLFFLRKFFDIKMVSKFLIGLVLIFAYFILARYSIEEIIFPIIFGTGNYFEGATFTYYIFDNLHWGSKPIIVSTIIWLVVNFIRTLQNEVVSNEEKKKAEIQFLKSQINPHFIFNTLNNIYSLVFRKSEQALPAIEKLSEIMRFTTYDTQKEFIPIGSELKYIISYIELEKIRNTKEIYISLQLEIKDENQLIPPYLLLPFIENCVKHGVLDDGENPILFHTKSSRDAILIEVKNKINKKLKDTHSGIGLTNLEKRLEYYFPNRHTFNVTNDGNYFESYLKIQLGE